VVAAAREELLLLHPQELASLAWAGEQAAEPPQQSFHSAQEGTVEGEAFVNEGHWRLHRFHLCLKRALGLLL